MSWPGPPPPLCAADVAIGKNCDGGAIIELLASNQLNFSQHQISTYVRQALNKGNEVGRLRIAAEFGLFSPSLSPSFHLSLWPSLGSSTRLLTGRSQGPGKAPYKGC